VSSGAGIPSSVTLPGFLNFRKPGNVNEDGIPAACDEIRHRTPVRAATCDLGVPDVILPITHLGYLALALHVESLQTSFIGSEYGPCLAGVQKNG